MARTMDQRGVTLSGDHFSHADYADDVAAMEYDPIDIARSLENIEAASSELGPHLGLKPKSRI